MRMTEAQYISGYNSAKDYAATLGRSFSLHAYGLAIKNGNSPSELRDKLTALDYLKTNPQLYHNFSEYLVARGVIKKPLGQAELLQTIMHQGPEEFYKEWETAQAASALQRIGKIDVGTPKSGSDISYKALQGFQKHLQPGQKPNFDIINAIPRSYWYEQGISMKALVAAVYGKRGPVDRINRAIAEFKLAQEQTPIGAPTDNAVLKTQTSE